MPGKLDKKNQDQCFVNHNLCGIKNFNLYSVCDGHGLNGHHVSEYVRENLQKQIASQNLKYDKETLVQDDKRLKYHIINNAYQALNRDLKKTMIDVNYSGTTNVSVFLYGKKLMCANVGDSRAVMGSLKKHKDSAKLEQHIRDQRQRITDTDF